MAALAKPILSLAAAGLVLVTAFALSARLWWAFDLFSHFRLQYVIAASILCLAALALRAYPVAAALAAVALVHGWAIKDLWLGGGTGAAAASGLPLRVVSANVLNSNPTPGKVRDFVRASDAHLVVLIDARDQRWRQVIESIAADYPHRAPDRWDEGARVILLSRHPILAQRVVRPPGGRRPYVVAELAAGERALDVVAVHPSSPSPADATDSHRRNLELAHIAENVEHAGRAVIVAGDFNTTPFSPHFQDLLAAAELRHAASGHGYIATWPRRFWPAQIPLDHILIRGPLAVTAMRRGPPIGSDHYPVIADLRLSGG